MRRRSFLLLATAAWPALAPGETKGGKLVVHVKYTGSGTWDDNHKMGAALWSSPDFPTNYSSMHTVATTMVDRKSATAVFANITTTPVYVSFAFDPSGAWDMKSGPPQGSSLGMYAKQPGTPAPVYVKQGMVTTITASFDDSVKMLR